MQLIIKIAAAGSCIFVATAAILGIVVSINKNAARCGKVECLEPMECIKEEDKYPTCICSSGFVTIETKTENGTEKVCRTKCESSECKAGEVCKYLGSEVVCVEKCESSDCEMREVCKDHGSRLFCVASMDLDTCYGIRCEDPEKCELVSNHPQCNCPSNELVVEISGTLERTCLKICKITSDCEMGEVCKDFESGAVCIASMYLDTCDDVRCELPKGCELVIDHPQCKCPSNGVVVEIEIFGTLEKTCLQPCELSTECETGEVCTDFDSGIVCIASVYLDTCDGVHCEDPEECELVNLSPKCKCASNELLIETDGTSERRCRKSCTDSDKCVPETLCFRESSSAPLYCEERGRIRSCSNDAVECSSNSECLRKNRNVDCYCQNGDRTLIRRTESGSERVCGNAGCYSEYNCRNMTNNVCYKDPYTKDIQCIEPSHVESCDYVECSQSFTCRDYENFSCGCLRGERNRGNLCHIACETDQQCMDDNSGLCSNGHCTRFTHRR